MYAPGVLHFSFVLTTSAVGAQAKVWNRPVSVFCVLTEFAGEERMHRLFMFPIEGGGG
jgi:hypothetical protein